MYLVPSIHGGDERVLSERSIFYWATRLHLCDALNVQPPVAQSKYQSAASTDTVYICIRHAVLLRYSHGRDSLGAAISERVRHRCPCDCPSRGGRDHLQISEATFPRDCSSREGVRPSAIRRRWFATW